MVLASCLHLAFPCCLPLPPPQTCALRSSEDVRAALCELRRQPCRDPGADPRLQVSGAPLLRPPCLSPLFFPLVCVRAHLLPNPMLNVGIHCFSHVSEAQNKRTPWGWAAYTVKTTCWAWMGTLSVAPGGRGSDWLPWGHPVISSTLPPRHAAQIDVVRGSVSLAISFFRFLPDSLLLEDGEEVPTLCFLCQAGCSWQQSECL